MSKKSLLKQIASHVKDADDIVEIVTGKRIHQIGVRIYNLCEPEIKRGAAAILKEEEEPADSPYRVLHCRPDASDTVVRYKYRMLVMDLHPDTGEHPDAKEFQRVVEAYNKIMTERR